MKGWPREYYFLVSSLPPLVLGAKPEISILELKESLTLNLSLEDQKMVEGFLRFFDLRNIRAFWLKQPLDEWGNWSTKELEEELLVQGNLPSYLADFLERYSSLEDRLRYFVSLYASLYREEGPLWGGFLSLFYQFEREVRLILTALRSKYFHRDVGWELQFEELFDPLVADILAQKDAPTYAPPKEFEELAQIFQENISQPHRLEMALLQYRFRKMEEIAEGSPFSMDQVLGYLARLRIVESYLALQQPGDVRALFAS